MSRGASGDQEVRIVVNAVLGGGGDGGAGTVVVQSTAQLLMPADRLAELVMVLSSNCVGKTCPGGQTCNPHGDCVSAVVDTPTLRNYSPGDEHGVDAGTDDASRSDATLPPDAGSAALVDAGIADDASANVVAEAGGDAGCPAGSFQCVGQQPQTCASGQWQDVGSACVNQVCRPDSGTCTDCLPNAQQCVVGGANTVRTCDANGAWGQPVACQASTCFQDKCQGCPFNTTRCDPGGGNAVQACDSTGTWGASVPCAKGVCDLMSGQCKGPCGQGDTQCSGLASMQSCGGDGNWAAAVLCTNQTCPATGTKCQGVCAQGDTQCDTTNHVKQTCDASGQWASDAVTQGVCNAQCTPGATPACNGAAAQSCSATGMLTVSPVTSGTCGAGCTPGTSPAQCSGTTPQTCGANGQWILGTQCAQPAPTCTQGACVCQAGSSVSNGVCCMNGLEGCAGSCINNLTDVGNCGDCGRLCSTSGTSSTACRSGSCIETCASNRENCNASGADGCECAGNGCCGSNCQTAHTNGVGNTFYDCSPLDTFTVQAAVEACTALGGNSSQCIACENGSDSLSLLDVARARSVTWWLVAVGTLRKPGDVVIINGVSGTTACGGGGTGSGGFTFSNWN